MEKEKVLEIEIVKLNEEYSAWYIKYQNEEVLKREEFRDDSLKIRSVSSADYRNGKLYLLGCLREFDKVPLPIRNEEVEELINKVNAVNEKYGIVKRWRAEQFEDYYYIDFDYFEINEANEDGHESDELNYEIGNYFQTKEEAEIYLEKIKKILLERE